LTVVGGLTGNGKKVNFAAYLGRVRVVRIVRMAARVSRNGERGVGEKRKERR